MALRCLLFSSDAGTAAPILEVLAGLEVEGEHCPEAVSTVEKVTHQNYQIVIIDWDQQPEAGLLLAAARERKANERPLTLAMVSDDASVPQALQAGANSILRKPLMVNQVRDTLTTARDLLRAKENAAQAAAVAAAASAAAGSATTLPASAADGERTLRAGEFLQTPTSTPGGHFETESDVASLDPTTAEPVDPLKELEPMAAAVPAPTPAIETRPAPPDDDEPRGLEWYKRARGIGTGAAAAPAPAPARSGQPDLLGYDDAPKYAPTTPIKSEDMSRAPAAAGEPPVRHTKTEPGIFSSYIEEGSEAETAPRRSFRRKPAIIVAVALAACAVVAAPQAPWHAQLRTTWIHGQQTVHAWLNPTLVTPTQAPASHENFGRAGDEYKLPVAENIPDATTDPSQIHVVPIVDPTVRKLNNQGANAEIPATDTPAADPAAQTQPTDVQPSTTAPGTAQPVNGSPADGPTVTVPTETSSTPEATTSAANTTATTHSDAPALAPSPAVTNPVVTAPPAPQKNPTPYVPAPTKVPSSLQSTMASMTPAAGGNKAPEAAMPSIEPVAVPEATERALLADQPALDYPASARGTQGTVVLQVLIGRDGTVEDAKFLQGSLAFARAAIDGVKQWKFKPYMMNGRPVSVATNLTISFKP